MFRTALGVVTVDENRPAASAATGFNIAPPISDHHTPVERDAPAIGSTQQKAWSGLPAAAPVLVVMGADQNVIDLNPTEELFVQGGNIIERHGSSRHVGLVRHDEQRETRFAQQPASFRDAIQDLHFVRARRGERVTSPHHGAV
jgi:hypothetical protein